MAPGEWTVTVSEGVGKCFSEVRMVTFTPDGVEYGLNQTAMIRGLPRYLLTTVENPASRDG